MIHIDRMTADLEVMRSSADDAAQPASGTAMTIDAQAMERLRQIVMEVLREQIRDLERRGLL